MNEFSQILKKHGHNKYEQKHKTYKRAFDEILAWIKIGQFYTCAF